MKSRLFKTKFSDLEAEVYENEWAVLRFQGIKVHEVSLGKYPNARFKVIEDLLEYVKKKNMETK